MPLPYLPTLLWLQVPFGDPDAWQDWLLPHYLMHQALAAATGTPLVPIDTLRDQLMPHAQMHQDLATALSLPSAWDFAGYDLRNRDSYYEFMLAHASHHVLLTEAAGI